MTERRQSRLLAGAAGLLAALVTAGPARAQDTASRRVDSVQIRIRLEDRAVTATLEDSGTVRDFVSLLPLTVTLEDYASTEKIAGLPRRLNTEDAPAGVDPSVGDIAYYAPWGNLAIFYRDFGYARGLVRLGTIDSGVEALARPGPVRAGIELLDRRSHGDPEGHAARTKGIGPGFRASAGARGGGRAGSSRLSPSAAPACRVLPDGVS